MAQPLFLRESKAGMRAAIRNCFKTALPYLTHRAVEMVAISYVPTACLGGPPCILVPFSRVGRRHLLGSVTGRHKMSA